VIRAPRRRGQLRCAGSLLVNRQPPACSEPPRRAGSIRPGLQLADELSGVIVLCTVGGDGILTFDGRELVQAASPRRTSKMATGWLDPWSTEAAPAQGS
jgi:hypothetical protein